MPSHTPYQRPFRIFAGVAITAPLVVLCISIWTPAGLSDETRKILGWAAGAIVVASVVLASRLGFKQGLWKLKEAFQVEVSDGKIIQRRTGSPIVEMSVDQIVSLHQSRGGWLIVRGGEPPMQMAIPSEIVGFEGLKREISESRTVSPPKIKLSPWLFLPSASFVLACVLLFVSHSRAVVMAAGGAMLLMQGFGIFSLRRRTRSNEQANFVAAASILSFLILVWIVYERATSHF